MFESDDDGLAAMQAAVEAAQAAAQQVAAGNDSSQTTRSRGSRRNGSQEPDVVHFRPFLLVVPHLLSLGYQVGSVQE